MAAEKSCRLGAQRTAETRSGTGRVGELFTECDFDVVGQIFLSSMNLPIVVIGVRVGTVVEGISGSLDSQNGEGCCATNRKVRTVNQMGNRRYKTYSESGASIIPLGWNLLWTTSVSVIFVR